MKSILLLTLFAVSYGSKLDKTYLPPATAQTAGGSDILDTPKPALGLVPDVTGLTSGGNKEQLTGLNGIYNGGYNGFNYGGINGLNNAGYNGLYNGGYNGLYNGAINGLYNGGYNGLNYGGISGLNNGGYNGLYNGAINGVYNGFNNGGINALYNGGSYQQPISNFNNYNSFAANSRPERPQAVFERNAAILSYDNVNNVNNYAYRYQTQNSIAADETGVATNGVVAQGGYSYVGDDGRLYSIRYTADENGFRPVGSHLPTPPPIPEAILRALEQNARDEAAGIFDDGSYNEALYGEHKGYNYRRPAASLANAAIKKQAKIQAQAINNLGNSIDSASQAYLPPKNSITN